MPVVARVIVLDRDAKAAEALAVRLNARGYGAVVSDAVDDPAAVARHPADIIVIQDLDAATIAARLHAAPETAVLPRIVVGPDAADGADAVLSRPYGDGELHARIDAAARLTTMRNELRRRGAVTALYGGEAPAIPKAPTGAVTARLLFVGDLEGEAHDIAKQLGGHAEVIVTPDSYSAMERLQTQVFDGILMPDRGDPETIIDFAEDVRRNPRLFHIPLLALLNHDDPLPESRFYAAGASQVLRRPLEAGVLRGHLTGLVRLYRHRLALMKAHRQARHPATTDSLTQHYTYGFLMATLSAQITDSLQENKNLSIGVLDVSNMALLNQTLGYVGGDRILRQAASMISNLVRGEDVVARCGGATFAIILPDTPPEIAQRVVGRVASVVEHTEYALPGRDDPTYVELRVGNASIAAADTANSLLKRALAAAH
jgi:diguanylate cyclase (GGDEF)-like protein